MMIQFNVACMDSSPIGPGPVTVGASSVQTRPGTRQQGLGTGEVGGLEEAAASGGVWGT